MPFIVESNFIHAGLQCVTLRLDNPGQHHRCGYVGIPASHPLFGKDGETEIPLTPALRERLEPQTVETMGTIPFVLLCAKLPAEGLEGLVTARVSDFFQVHGGITFSRGFPELADYPILSDLWWFGFDCAHCDDNYEEQVAIADDWSVPVIVGQPLLYVIEQTKKLADQLATWPQD